MYYKQQIEFDKVGVLNWKICDGEEICQASAERFSQNVRGNNTEKLRYLK